VSERFIKREFNCAMAKSREKAASFFVLACVPVVLPGEESLYVPFFLVPA